MKPITGKADHFIEHVSGCGNFQVFLLVTVVFTVMLSTAYTLLFMSFANYNPGWRCLDYDNISSSHIKTNPVTMHNVTSAYNYYNNVSNISINGSEYNIITTSQESCDAYKQCASVKFNTETVTIVSEWGLVCDQAWIPSLIISMMMMGMLVGSFLGGQLSDVFGRKKLLYASIAVNGLVQLVGFFSVNWQMMVVVQFFTGALSNCNFVIILLYIAEFMTVKWRDVLILFPFWYFGALGVVLVSYVFKDWRYLMFVGFVLHVICFLPICFVPESLRWLEVKGHVKKFEMVAKKIAKMNRIDHHSTSFGEDGDDINPEQQTEEKPNLKNDHTKIDKMYTVKDIFRHGYKVRTICIGIFAFLISGNYYALTYGTKSLYGDFYFNLFVTNISAIPIFLLGVCGMRRLRRKTNNFVFLLVACVCTFCSTAMLLIKVDVARDIMSTLFISVARGTMDVAYFSLHVHVTEMYPTVVRGIALGYSILLARLAGVLAPYLIPQDESKMYLFTIGTGLSLLVCVAVETLLPETKGVPLTETFDDEIIMIDILPKNNISDVVYDLDGENKSNYNKIREFDKKSKVTV